VEVLHQGERHAGVDRQSMEHLFDGFDAARRSADTDDREGRDDLPRCRFFDHGLHVGSIRGRLPDGICGDLRLFVNQSGSLSFNAPARTALIVCALGDLSRSRSTGGTVTLGRSIPGTLWRVGSFADRAADDRLRVWVLSAHAYPLIRSPA